jgi:hypothetical protein
VIRCGFVYRDAFVGALILDEDGGVTPKVIAVSRDGEHQFSKRLSMSSPCWPASVSLVTLMLE